MTLTVEHAPFAPAPSGRFNVQVDRSREVLFWDPVPHRVRAIFNGQTVVDSRSVVLLHETGHLPVYYFPRDAVRRDLLEISDRQTTCSHKGQARYWNVRVDDRSAPDAIWEYPEPVKSASFLTDYVALDWHAFDEWFVEDEQAFGHPRDPYTRIDVYKSTRHVRVLLDGELLADSRRPKVLFETSLPPRYYLPSSDIRTELLVPSSTRSRCAYKGSASYWHVQVAIGWSKISCGPIPTLSTTASRSVTSTAFSTSALSSSWTASAASAHPPGSWSAAGTEG
jgi:uncharacterized protein (DUF427 family)